MHRLSSRTCVLLTVLLAALGVAPVTSAAARPGAAADVGVWPGDPHGQAAYIPITTRVPVTTGSKIAIQVGSTSYPAPPDGAGTIPAAGFEILLISRAWSASTSGPVTAAVIPHSNKTYSVTNATELSAFQSAITSPAYYAPCQGQGCYLVVSSIGSLGQNYSCTSPCTYGNLALGELFESLGGTPSAGYPADATYSLITPVGYDPSGGNGSPVQFAGRGTGNEALSCVFTSTTSSAPPCQARNTSAPINDGAVSGALVQGASGQALGFTSVAPQTIVSRQPVAGQPVNEVLVNGQGYYSDPTVAGGPTYPTGFQVVQLSRTTLKVLSNQTFHATSDNTSGGLYGMLAMLQASTAQNEDYLWVVSSIGKVVSSSAGPAYPLVAQQLTTIGGNFQVFTQLGQSPISANTRASGCPSQSVGDYTLIGWMPPPGVALVPTRAALESSGLVACETQGPDSYAAANVNQTALMTVDSRGLYSPSTYGPQPTPSSVQADLLNNSTVGFPATVGAAPGTPPTTAQASAYVAISQQFAFLSPTTDDVRSQYSIIVGKTNSVTQMSTDLTGLDCADLASKSNNAFQPDDCTDVAAELSVEQGQLSNINQMYTTLYQTYQDVFLSSSTSLKDVANAVAKSLGVGESDGRTVAADLVSLGGSLAADLTTISGAGEIVGAGIDAAAQTLSFALNVTSPAAAASGVLTTQWNNLADDMLAIFTSEQKALLNILGVAVSDPVRLGAISTDAAAFNSNAVNTDANLSQQLLQGVTYTYYGALMATQYRIYTVYGSGGQTQLTSASGFASPYPQVLPADISLHSMVCNGKGTCGAQKITDKSLLLQTLGPAPNAANDPSKPYAWGYQFIATGPSCSGLSYCTANSPSTAVMNTLFSNPDQNATPNPLGLYQAYFYGRGSPLPVAQSSGVCQLARTSLNQSCSNGSVVGAPRPGRLETKPVPKPPLKDGIPIPTGATGAGAAGSSASPLGTGNGAGTSGQGTDGSGSGGDGLAFTGPAVDPVPLLGVGLAAVVLGAVLLAAAPAGRRRRARHRRA